jgi:transposase
MKFEWFIGIDISKKTLDFDLHHESKSILDRQVENSRKGINSLLSSCKKMNVDFEKTLFCLEHTGIYNELLVDMLCNKKMNVWVEQGIHVKRSLGLQRGKTDKVDAFRLSEYAFRFQDKCKLWKSPSTSIKELKNLTTLRARLIKARKLLKVPVNELVGSGSNKKSTNVIVRLNKPVLDRLKVQIKAVEKQIEEVIKKDERLLELEELVTSVDGVGPVTARAIIIATNQFQAISDGRKFACYAGVVPFSYQSGTSINGKPRVSHFADKNIKQLLHLSALSATVMKGELNDYYNRKVAEGKNKMLVLNNIRNKLVLRIFACVNENRKYEKSYTHMLA